MKTEMQPVHIAFDGTAFLREADCLEHEEAHFSMRFVGLTRDQVLDAMERKNAELADAFERAGQRIAALRRESGELRRRGSKPNGDPPPQISTSPEDRLAPLSDAAIERTLADAELGE